jgi:hypothetical protein
MILYSVDINQTSVEFTLDCLDTFCVASRAVIGKHKTEFWLVGIEDHLAGFPMLGNTFSWGNQEISWYLVWHWYLSLCYVRMMLGKTSG